MKKTGIICEFNPLHGGHKYLLDTAREKGAELVICVMSGSFVQRGEAAIADKYSRAAAAVECGADIVLELPYPWSASGAESFAAAGVEILAGVGADGILFGSECGDVTTLQDAAGKIMTEQFAERYRALCRGGRGGAAAYFEAYREVTGEQPLWGANDLLGIEYIKAIGRRHPSLTVQTITRLGAAYGEKNLTDDIHPSATAIREKINADGICGAKGLLSRESYDALCSAEERGDAPSRIENIGSAIIAFLRMCEDEYMEGIAETADGLGNRLLAAAAEATNYGQLIRLAAAANHTASRVKRAALFAVTGTRDEDIHALPRYTLLLGASEKGRAYLSETRKSRTLPIVTKPADAAAVAGGERQYELCRRADALWALTTPTPHESGYLAKMKPYFN